MINLKELAKNGTLGEVYITMHADRVVELIGEPDFAGGGSRKQKWDSIYRYGSLELGFEANSKELNYIAINFAQEFESPKHFEYDSWVLSSELASGEFITACEFQEIEFKMLDEAWNEGCKEYLTDGGMHLCFDEEDKLVKFVVSDHGYS